MGRIYVHDVQKLQMKINLQIYYNNIKKQFLLGGNYYTTIMLHPHGVGGADNYCGLLNFLYNHEKYDPRNIFNNRIQRQSFWLEESKFIHNLTSDIYYSANNLNLGSCNKRSTVHR